MSQHCSGEMSSETNHFLARANRGRLTLTRLREQSFEKTVSEHNFCDKFNFNARVRPNWCFPLVAWSAAQLAHFGGAVSPL